MKAKISLSGRFGKNKTVVLILLSTLLAGIFRWTVSYEGIENGNHWLFWIIGAALAGIFSVIFERNIFKAAVFITTGFVTAVVFRIIFDIIFIDPTSHNIFPIEIIIWAVLAFIPAILGAVIGYFIKEIVAP
ncbi:MAG TPA: hypothetical protein DER09_12480 [Prolixibacteraceae bacterium]|nr:hypothetical protein [Prolixibacteraceae bacterium]